MYQYLVISLRRSFVDPSPEMDGIDISSYLHARDGSSIDVLLNQDWCMSIADWYRFIVIFCSTVFEKSQA